MLPNYFDYIFVYQRQKVRLKPQLTPKFLSTLGPNLARIRPERPGPTYSSDRVYFNVTIVQIMQWHEDDITHTFRKKHAHTQKYNITC